MRWFCLVLATVIVTGSPWMGADRAQAQQPARRSVDIQTLPTDFTSVTVTPVRLVELEGISASPVPEPSTGAAVSLLASAFLIRRRRPRLD